MSVSTGTGLRLTSASIRHMSAQLVPDLAEERDALRTLLLRLDALRPLAVHRPEASQNATPNLIPGTDPTRASWTSSAVLMKWVCPRITLSPPGFSIGTSSVSTCIADVSGLAN